LRDRADERIVSNRTTVLRRRGAWAASTALLLVVGAAASFVGAQAVARDDAANSHAAFTASSVEIASTLRLAIQQEQDLVVSASAFFVANPDATTTEFRAWTRSMHAFERYPELQGFGMAVIVTPSQLPAFAARAVADPTGPLAADGSFEVLPAGLRDFYCLPSAGENRSGSQGPPAGFDFCAGKARAAWLRSRDSGRAFYVPLQVGRSTLLNVNTPIYRGGVAPATVAARRELYIGGVGDVLASAVVLERALEGHPHTALAFRYHQGASDAMFRSGRAPDGARSVTNDLRNGWTVQTSASVAGGRIFADRNALLVLLGGLALTLLLGLLDSARRRRGRAQTEERVLRESERALRESERVLRESEQRLDALLHNSSDMITVVAPDGTVLYQAGSVHSVLGHAPSQLVGTKLTDWASPDDAALLLALCQTQETAGAELELRHADGSLRACEVRATSLLDHPAWEGVVLNIRDVSDRKQLEIELRLAQKLESVGALAAGIAHEINTPIQYVSSSVEFLDGAFTDTSELLDAYASLRDAAAPAGVDAELLARVNAAEETADLEYLRERVPAAFERTRDGLARVAKIVGAMRVFGNPPTSGSAPVDINAAIENTLVVAAGEYRYVADLTTDLGDIPLVLGNGGDLNQVLINLIVNASHAIADIVDGTDQRGQIHVRTRVQEDHAVITITDTGGGIPAEIADRVFDPFFTTKDVGRGTGQGLAIARTIIDRDGGQLTFTTRPGDGTTFTIRLPLTDLAIAA
jgi:PAS domain S-box-containing protein